MPRYEIRGASLADEDELFRLAAYLNTVNLPNDRAQVRELLKHAERSFTGELVPAHRKFVFLLWDLERARAIGTSTIIAQLGRRDAPYIYFDVLDEERYSKTLNRHFHHTALRLGFSYDGPTELGGLVVDPTYRRAPERLGRFVSYARFLFIAAQRKLFKEQIVAELLPPLEPDGTSHLWEALGRHFTGMSYAEADLLSSQDKEFIRELFPTNMIYTSLLSKQAQAVIGRVGPQTLGVARMLREVGFRYNSRVDPFDGGPHFAARIDEVSSIRDARSVRFVGTAAAEGRGPSGQGIVLGVMQQAPFARSVLSPFQLEGTSLSLPEDVVRRWSLAPGDELFVLALPRPSVASAPADAAGIAV
jgi:arginine N-succinyltransferase